jgi:predicted DNA-binding transcriptional regulator YafY
MVKLSQLLAAAEDAPQDRLEKALQVLVGDQDDVLLTADEVAARFRVSRRTIYRRAHPVETLGGKNWYREQDVRRDLSA